jgi:hypothetical protein
VVVSRYAILDKSIWDSRACLMGKIKSRVTILCFFNDYAIYEGADALPMRSKLSLIAKLEENALTKN